MVIVTSLFLAYSVVEVWRFKLSELTQTGVSSLSLQSVYWLEKTAFFVALLICLVLSPESVISY